MKKGFETFEHLQSQLVDAAKKQDRYDLTTTNLIAPASPTLPQYIDIPLRHNAIAEGLLGHRPYAGAEHFNRIEEIAGQAACMLFGAEHANTQPHSVSQANQAVYQALLENGDKVLAMKFQDGGHLTHGLRINFSGRFFNFDFYGVDSHTGLLDYSAIEAQVKEFAPRMVVCGASSYPRAIDFEKLASISRQVNAYLMADLSHPAGLIAAHRFPQPFPSCDVVTLTPDKTMLGPHGGIVLCKKELAEKIDKGIHPGVQSSVPLRRIYEMAQCFINSGGDWFNDYISRLLKNMKVFEQVFGNYPSLMVTGGSDTHLMVLNTHKIFGLTGKEAEETLEKVGILTNRQVVPGETLKPYVASGVRLGASWITARGYSEAETREIATTMVSLMDRSIKEADYESVATHLKDMALRKRLNDVWIGEMKSLDTKV